MSSPAAGPVRLVLRAEALRLGMDDDEIGRRRRRDGWQTLQRGAYLVGSSAVDRRARHLLAVRASVAGLRTTAVLSHASAAALHGLPLWAVGLGHVHVTRHPPARSGESARLRCHVARLPAEEVTVVDGLAVTSVARTVVDLARVLPFGPALAIADAALHAGATSPPDLAAVLAGHAGTRGSRSAARVVAAADGRSESVGESRSRALFLESGLPAPDLQVEVPTAGGQVYAADFGWSRARLLGEFDGLVKYGRLLRPGETPADAVVREKLREDAMRDQGWRMARWVWRELDAPAALLRRLAARLGQP